MKLKEEISAAEALFGFCGWLTTRKERTKMSSSDNAAPVADLVGKFCKVQKLKEPRERFTDYLKRMKESKKEDKMKTYQDFLEAEGKGQGGGTAEGPGGDCICPKCGEVSTHQTGIPCTERKCPKCGTMMKRKV